MTETEASGAPDAELVARAQQGENQAFGALYQRYLDPIYRYIRMRVNSDADAEDLCETVFLRSFEALDRYEDQGHPYSAFLYRLARNLLVDHYRAQRPIQELEHAGESASIDPALGEQFDQRQQLDQIAQALEQLSEDYREVIRLRVVMELPTATVAQWMERSPGAVRVLLHRALGSLREKLEDGAA